MTAFITDLEALAQKLRAELTGVGAMDNGMVLVPAAGVRQYLEQMEALLAEGRKLRKPEPEAYRQWSSKFHDWDYETNRSALRPDTEATPLYTLQGELDSYCNVHVDEYDRLHCCKRALEIIAGGDGDAQVIAQQELAAHEGYL